MNSFCKCKSYSHFFSNNIGVYAIFDDQNFNDMLSKDIISFQQLGPGHFEVLLYFLYIFYRFMLLKDFDAYIKCQDQVSETFRVSKDLYYKELVEQVDINLFCIFFSDSLRA